MPLYRPPITGGGGGVVHYNQPFAGVTTATVSHNLGYIPDVNIRDPSGSDIVGLINHSSVNSFTVTFNIALAGTIYYT